MRKLTKATTKVVNAELYGAEKLYSANGYDVYRCSFYGAYNIQGLHAYYRSYSCNCTPELPFRYANNSKNLDDIWNEHRNNCYLKNKGLFSQIMYEDTCLGEAARVIYLHPTN